MALNGRRSNVIRHRPPVKYPRDHFHSLTHTSNTYTRSLTSHWPHHYYCQLTLYQPFRRFPYLLICHLPHSHDRKLQSLETRYHFRNTTHFTNDAYLSNYMYMQRISQTSSGLAGPWPVGQVGRVGKISPPTCDSHPFSFSL